MRQAILKAAQNGMPISGECGGFLYLQEQLEGEDGRIYPMTGVLPGTSVRKEKLGRFGYIELTAKRNAGWVKEGEQIKGHEFHYWDCTKTGAAFHAQKPLRKKNWECIVAEENLFAGYPHIYFYSAVRWLRPDKPCSAKSGSEPHTATPSPAQKPAEAPGR